jgi:hypothetical protein
MVICFILAEVRVKLVPDGIKELADAGARVVSRGRARHAAMRIQRHGVGFGASTVEETRGP